MWLVVDLICFYPAYAVDAKRFHDRGKPGWYALAMPVSYYAALFVEGADWVAHESISSFTLPLLMQVLILLSVLLWFLIELGGMRGTEGSNRYGSDPSLVPDLSASSS